MWQVNPINTQRQDANTTGGTSTAAMIMIIADAVERNIDTLLQASEHQRSVILANSPPPALQLR